MERSIVIPVAHLPELTIAPNGTKTKLPARPGPGLYGDTTPRERAEHYYQEAMDKLALAMYWMEKAE